MDSRIDRRTLLRRAAVGGGLLMAGPLQACADRGVQGRPTRGHGYGPLVSRGEIALPEGFGHRVISRAGARMSDGAPTPTSFDGMAAFRGPRNTTILIRNHENRAALQDAGDPDEIRVVVPERLRYDAEPPFNGGSTKIVVDSRLEVVRDFAILGGTAANCAGGPTPWGSWITCEEAFVDGSRPHGYIFEIDASADGPVAAVPIRAAGRFMHEAVAWYAGTLYETEDRGDAALYRYVPDRRPRKVGDLAASAGRLQALRIRGGPEDTRSGFPVGRSFRVDWVDVADVEPASESGEASVRAQAHAAGAAVFSREEGAWATGGERIYFDCTEGGAAEQGQIWELDPRRDRLRLVYESEGEDQLNRPDNLCLVPRTGDVLLCEDGDGHQVVRGLTADGEIYDVVRSIASESEFCGACFDPRGGVLYLNQQGADMADPGRTYAVWGPWARRRGRRG